MKSKITPGPWFIEFTHTALNIGPLNYKSVCRMRKTNLANAQAVAAVPEMIAALEAFLNLPIRIVYEKTGAKNLTTAEEERAGFMAMAALKKAGVL